MTQWERKAPNIRPSRQRGMTLPMVALFIVVLFAMASLAVDLGILYTARTSAQHAADAAALGGAYTFLYEPLATDAQKIANATDSAIAVAAQNQVLNQPVTITAANVVVDPVLQRVTVTVPLTGASSVSTYFARVIGWNNVDVGATATAEAGKRGTGTSCLKPIFLPNTIVSNELPSDACNNGHYIFDPNVTLTDAQGNSYHPYTDWFKNVAFPQIIAQYSSGTAPTSPVQSQPMNIRPTAPSGALQPSQFYSLDFGSGAATYRCTLGQCLNDCGVSTTTISCGTALPVETGNMVGPTNQGINDLIGNPPDTFVGLQNGQFIFGPGEKTTSNSTAVTAVWNNCPDTVSSGYHGQTVPVVGFSNLFFKGMQSGNVQAYFLGATECSGMNAPAPSRGPLAMPVRLIQPAQ